MPEGALERYDRVIDALREDPEILARVWVDPERLCAAEVVDDEDGDD